MIGQLIKKQFLLFMRNRHELLVLLGMPLLLITILGLALGNIMKSDAPSIHAKIALVERGNEQADLQKFVHGLENQDIPPEQKQMMADAAKQMLPVTALKNSISGSKELKPYITLVTAKPSELEKIRKDTSYTAIIEIPRQFTYSVLQNAFFGQTQQPELFFYTNEKKEISSKIVEEIVTLFQEHYSTFSALGKSGLLNGSFRMPAVHVESKVETVTKREPINAITYYMVGMSVMFVLYIASNIGSYAFCEKQLHVFNRILLANVSKWSYMIGIFISSVLLAFFQLVFLYGITSLIYHIRWPHVTAFFAVTLALCFAVGGLSVLLTSLNYRLNSEHMSNFFATIVVTLFSLLGGSFFPSNQLSGWIHTLGNLTPNGSGMTAYLKILQGYDLPDVAGSILYLCLFGTAMAIAAVFIFPKKGELS
ncbi:ABC transporter permease [Parageobacillus thermoglucosidasius]|uniref:ABC transporter permease n=1 Tax=Parageobacillus thermoglucosidasius TaxID=1426 RepID=A0AB38R1P8_PARTM|nr:ABC transporter permease [Parageobacillus thermoglucosidasius]UOE77629.1 ABC transporter permease [Parageobacillus thermoglucosidasius]